MAIFYDRTKTEPKKVRHREFKLVCSGCKIPTLHVYDHTVPIGINTIDLTYECTRCGEQRFFGRENTSTMLAGDDDEEDIDDHHITT